MTREHGTRVRYSHGPDQNGQPGKGCRCEPCSQAKSAAVTHRARLIAYGRWEPYVDACLVREHLQMLSSYGVGYRRAAELAGVSFDAVRKLLRGGPGERPPARRIRPETAAKILEVRPSLEVLSDGALTCSAGTVRRLQALVAVGYSQARIAALLGVPSAELRVKGRTRVTAARARAVRELYDELWDTPPAAERRGEKISVSLARAQAEANGWAPPMAWDDDSIDDPGAEPAEGWRRRDYLSSAELADEADELGRQGYDRALAAERLGVRRCSIDQAYKRARRSA